MSGLSGNAIWIYYLGTIFTDTLWQGIIIGLSLFIGTLFLKRGDARSRYNLAAVALLTFLLWTGFDLLRVIHMASQMPPLKAGIGNNLLRDFVPLQGNTGIPSSGLNFSSITGFFSVFYESLARYYYFIVPLWITGIFMLSIRLAGGWVVASRTRKKVFNLPSSWHNCADYLQKRLNISQKVSLKGSFNAISPMVIGYFKPVILVPSAIISSLSYNEMEAILAHELAHIRRHDFLFICIQNMAEILLFYHPVTWMISSFLNKEREKCCDDIAVSITNNSLPFAKAITLMENIRVNNNMPAALLIGSSNKLFIRIKRILHNGIRKSSLAERIAASVIIITGLFLISAFAGYAHNKPSETSKPKVTSGSPISGNNQVSVLPDTLKKYRETRMVEAEMADDSTKSTTSYKITYENDSVKDLIVNKKKISRDHLDEYQKKLAEIMELGREESLQNIHVWNDNKHMRESMEMAMQQSKFALEKAMMEFQLNQQYMMQLNPENLKMQHDELFLQMQKLQQEKILKDFMMHPGDSTFFNHGEFKNAVFPQLNDKEMREMKTKMEKLQMQLNKEMQEFQQEFQKKHGKMIDSLKREMEILQRNMTFPGGGAFFGPAPEFNNPGFNANNSFFTPLPGQLFWNQEPADTSAMDDKLRKLEK
jgi:bla regulator protein BlaR1